ncbi:MAG: YhcH/YjgK/YiaL family protein [Eubacteriales bacterium]|nr:YhcH/YjgK/YiaL family protein [Eubacteriales bacterium]
MISDKTERLNHYRSALPGVDKAVFAHEKKGIDIAKAFTNEGIKVIEKAYDTREDINRKFEEHFHTVDLMICLEGEETIHVQDSNLLKAGENLPDGKDGRKLNGEPQGMALHLKAGHFVAFFPGEAHMVAGHVSNKKTHVKKLVVKIDLQRNLNPNCPCTSDCIRHGICAECVVWHRQPNNSLPACLREKGKILIEKALNNM